MKKLYFLTLFASAILFGTSFATHIDSDQARIKAKQLHKNFENTIPGQLLDTTLFYTAAGWYLKGAGNLLHRASGLTEYNYDQKRFGQINTINYPEIPSSLSRTRQTCAQTAHKLLSLGSSFHWPLRSARDFGFGVFAHIKYMTISKNDADGLQYLKKAKNEALLRSPLGMAVGLAAYNSAHTLMQKHTEQQ